MKDNDNYEYNIFDADPNYINKHPSGMGLKTVVKCRECGQEFIYYHNFKKCLEHMKCKAKVYTSTARTVPLRSTNRTVD
jgi:hypothetical protein